MFNIKNKIAPADLMIQIFYFFVAFDALSFNETRLNSLVSGLVSAANYPVTIQYLDFFTLKSLATALMILNFIIPGLCFMYANARALRILNLILFFITKGVIFRAYRFNHAYWPCLWALAFLAVPKKLTPDLKYDPIGLWSYRGAVFSVTSIYWFSALWKITEGLQSGLILKTDYASNTIALYLLTHGKSSLLGHFFVEHEILSYVGFIGIILLQLSSFFCIFSLRWLRTWPFLILGFHAISLLVLQINFFTAGVVAFIICYYAPKDIVIHR